MIPSDIVEHIIKKVQEMQKAEASDLDRHQERIKMFVGARFTKWINEQDNSGWFIVLKKTTISCNIETIMYGKCHFDIYNDAQVYVSSYTETIYNDDFGDRELIMKCHKESSILMDEEDIIVSCERLWMH
jgi:outer membrane receptor for ferric coprogen and ferric-rhodotorulic acid